MVDQTRFLKGTNPFILQVIQIYSYIQHVYYIHINMYIYMHTYLHRINTYFSIFMFYQIDMSNIDQAIVSQKWIMQAH